MLLTKADIDKVDLEPLRPYVVSPEEFFAPKQHYRLLALLASMLPPGAKIIDIGTHMGDSALALSIAGHQVWSFDIEDRRSGRAARPDGDITFFHEDLWHPPFREIWGEALLESALILIDIDPHEGTRELELVNWLRSRNYQGLIVLDDIWYFKPMRDQLWYNIEPKHRWDATALGHWSGTGIVSFNEDRVLAIENTPNSAEDWTLVTGYFDLTGKDDANDAIRARPASHYIDQHGTSVLSLDKNLIVFCDFELEGKIWDMRPPWLWKRTHVIPMRFEDFPLHAYKEQIVQNRGGSACPADPRNTASYYLFCMARYAMLKQAIRDNPFHSSHFAWINICIERMGFNNLIHLDEALGLYRDKFSTCWIDYVSKEDVRDLPKYFAGCVGRCSMCSGFFTGSKSHMYAACNQIEAAFVRCVEAGYGHADEQLFPIVYYENPDLFDWYIGDYTEMITNYAGVYEHPERPVQNLIRNSLAAGNLEVAARAREILINSVATGKCAASAELLK